MGEYIAYGVLLTCKKPVTITDLHNRANAMFSRNHFQKLMVNAVEAGEVELAGEDDNCYGRPGKLYKLNKAGRKVFKGQHTSIKKVFSGDI